MAWVSLGEALENAVAKALEGNGDGAADTAPVSPKEADPEGPAQVALEGTLAGKPADSLHANKGHTGRWERIVVPKRGAPPLTMRCHLHVIEGGRQTAKGGTRSAGLLRNAVTGRVRKLKLVVG